MNMTTLELAEIHLGKAIDYLRVSYYSNEGILTKDDVSALKMEPIEQKLHTALNLLQKLIHEKQKLVEENKKVDKDVKKLVKKAAKTVKKEIDEVPEGNRFMPNDKWEHKGRMPKSELKKGKKCTKKT